MYSIAVQDESKTKTWTRRVNKQQKQTVKQTEKQISHMKQTVAKKNFCQVTASRTLPFRNLISKMIKICNSP